MATKDSAPLKSLALLALAAMAWGGMFPVAKAALSGLDAFYLTAIRYGTAALIFTAILAFYEGRGAFSLEGKAGLALLFGTAGFAGFSLFAFSGLERTQPEHGAIIVATMPLITAIVNWVWKGKTPPAFTAAAIVVAFAGVVLVVTDGHLNRLLGGGEGLGDLLVFLGALSWVIYTLGAAAFPGWSALRYSTLTCVLGALSIFTITAIASESGAIHPPTLTAVVSVGWEMGYIILIASIIAVLSWNAGIQRAGALNGMLFSNLVPVTALAIGALQGHRFGAAEMVGAGLVVGSLVANNLYLRRQGRRGIIRQPA